MNTRLLPLLVATTLTLPAYGQEAGEDKKDIKEVAQSGYGDLPEFGG